MYIDINLKDGQLYARSAIEHLQFPNQLGENYENVNIGKQTCLWNLCLSELVVFNYTLKKNA